MESLNVFPHSSSPWLWVCLHTRFWGKNHILVIFVSPVLGSSVAHAILTLLLITISASILSWALG